MENTLVVDAPVSEQSDAEIKLSHLEMAIKQGAQLLPAQGPITAFVFLNTLEALEDLPFDEGVKQGARLFGCQPYMTEDQYHEKVAQQRIRPTDIMTVLREDLGSDADAPILTFGTRFDFRMAMLRYPLRHAPTAELRWFVAETDALTKFRSDVPAAVRDHYIEETRHWVMRDVRNGRPSAADDRPTSGYKRHIQQLLAGLFDHFGNETVERWTSATWEAFSLQALWRICRGGVHGLKPSAPPSPRSMRHRELLLRATGEDSDRLVNEVLVRFCAAYTDQGFSHWQLPGREKGIYRSFLELYRKPFGPPDKWLRGLSTELNRIAEAGLSPQESILESLELLGVQMSEWGQFVTETLLALRGWAGMIYQMEVRTDRVPVPAPPGSLAEFLAVRLILDRIALQYVARHSFHYSGPLSGLREAVLTELSRQEGPSVEQRAFLIFQLAQALGWYPGTLARLSKSDWAVLLTEVETFSELERRRIFQMAFERRFRVQALDAISAYTRRPAKRVESPRFQSVYCIDAREESFRRHLEELAPDCETFGAPGFFCIPMYYRGAADAHFSTLCPIVVQPVYWLVEDVVTPLEDSHRRRAKTRRALGTATRQVHMGTRSMAGGLLLTAGLGVLASIPLVARVLFPRLTSRIMRGAGKFLETPPVTRLRMDRVGPVPAPNEDGFGFSLEEMANHGERILRDIGLLSGFARLVFFFGHGSFCLNNPHKSAYDCGACSGCAGGPNARALAAMLNDWRVREMLARRGLEIPRTTYFIGALHNTCNDEMTYYDLDLMPRAFYADFDAARQTLEQVCERNSHERCRRFDSAPLNLSFAAARRHSEERSEDLAQVRPEFGNASNAMCIVARRERLRGLYLDRRSFLVSYDPTQDDAESSILARILAAAVPVCSGINLQYYFSRVDSPGWGSGTKLPHNVTSLLGVMDGAASDMRTGLPWQGVEIHEPLRLLMLIETTPQAIRSIMQRNPVVDRILRNGWAQLALLDPQSSRIQILRNNEFYAYQPESSEVPRAATSFDWYRGWRDHLPFAIIGESANGVVRS